MSKQSAEGGRTRTTSEGRATMYHARTCLQVIIISHIASSKKELPSGIYDTAVYSGIIAQHASSIKKVPHTDSTRTFEGSTHGTVQVRLSL